MLPCWRVITPSLAALVVSVMIGRTKKPIGNCRFGLWEAKNSAIRLRISLIKFENCITLLRGKAATIKMSQKKIFSQSRDFVRVELKSSPCITFLNPEKDANHGYLDE
jgi:hypothetical protein